MTFSYAKAAQIAQQLNCDPATPAVKMSPRLLGFDHADGGIANTIGSGDVDLLARRMEYLKGLSVGQFRHPVPLSIRENRRPRVAFRLTALRHHVCNVIVVRAEPQMVKVPAGAHVAFVHDLLARRDRPIRQFPCQAMNRVGFAVDVENAVSVATNGSGKQVAAVRLNSRVVVQTLRRRPIGRASEAFRHGVYCSRHSPENHAIGGKL